MPYFYSASTKGFYETSVHGTNMPSDAVAITNAEYQTLMAAQGAGQIIQADMNGNPVAVNPPAPTAAQLAQGAYAAAIAAGCEIISTSMPAVNGTYSLSDSDKILLVGEQAYIALKGTFTNGQASRAWMDAGGAPHVFPMTALFLAFGEAIAQYMDALQTALATALGGGTWEAPGQPVTIA